MARVQVTRDIEVSASRVWELVGDFPGAARWAPLLKCEVEGEGIGCVRTFRMPGGDTLRERLDAHDAAARSYRTSILSPGPLPIRAGRCAVRVLETGPDRARAEFIAEFEPVGVSEDKAERAVEGLLLGGVHTVKELLEG